MVAVVSPFPPSSSLFSPLPSPPPPPPSHFVSLALHDSPPTTYPDKSFSQTLPGLLAKMVPKRKDVVKVVVLFQGVGGLVWGAHAAVTGRASRSSSQSQSACGGRRPTPLRRRWWKYWPKHCPRTGRLCLTRELADARSSWPRSRLSPGVEERKRRHILTSSASHTDGRSAASWWRLSSQCV